MRLVMGISADDVVARGPDDDMRWLGCDDKVAFRLLTAVGGTCGVGSATRRVMPPQLPGRRLVTLTRRKPVGPQEMGLVRFATLFPDGWLLGGQTVALAALEGGLLVEAHLCLSPEFAYDPLRGPPDPVVRDAVRPALRGRGWAPVVETRVGEALVQCWRPGRG